MNRQKVLQSWRVDFSSVAIGDVVRTSLGPKGMDKMASTFVFSG